MITLKSRLATLPYCQFRKNRYFYPMYDSFYLGAGLTALAVMTAAQWQFPLRAWSWSMLAWLPIACYAQILCSVFVHVCTHKSLPPSVNRLVGELCGVVVLTRFASWEIIHQRHHQYTDDLERDPHPVVASYWRFLVQTVVNVEMQLQKIFFELHGGRTAQNERYEKWRARLSYATNIVILLTWYRFLGPVAFVGLFVPASLVGFLHLVHFNWSTHNAEAGANFHPVNLNRGFYRAGNKLFFGIYMHGNHHRRPSVLNPATIPEAQPAGELAQAA